MKIKAMRTSIVALAVAAALCGCTRTPTSVLPPVSSSTASDPARTSDGIPVNVQTVIPTIPDDPKKLDGGGVADLRQSVYYEFDRYEVKPQYRTLVEQHARWLRANPAARLVIVGNTDERGTPEYNLALGQRRAESVTRLLVLLGAREEQVEAVSFGKEKPRAAGHDETSWAQNRRSDFAKP